jgi:hypothetical protein
VTIRIENPKLVTGKNGKEYCSFWVRVFDGALGCAVAGWKFFPNTGTVGTPSQYKGSGAKGAKFVMLVKPTKEFYNAVREQVKVYFAVGLPNEVAIVDENDYRDLNEDENENEEYR